MEHQVEELESQLRAIREAIQKKKDKEQALAAKLENDRQGYLRLNIGGLIYTTSRYTLAKYPDSMLESLVSGRFELKTLDDGTIFIDRDGTHFNIILNALRDNGQLHFPPGFTDFEALAREIEFYQLPFKVPRAKGALADLTRTEFCKLLVSSPTGEKSFVGLRFCGLDLANMQFNNINTSSCPGFPVRLTGCDFSGCDLSRTIFLDLDLSGCKFVTADLTCCRFNNCRLIKSDFTGAVMHSAIMTKCDLTDATLTKADLSKADCSDSNFTRADVRSANITKTTFIGCNMSAVNLQGTDTSTADWTKASGVLVKK